MTRATVDGQTVKIGDWVGFKCDIEQGGQITKITNENGRTILTLEDEDGFSGEYIHGETRTTMAAEDCWVD